MKTWQWIVMAVIAGYGAVLSTYNAISSRKQNKHQITVSVSHGLLAFGPQLSDQMIMVNASNRGHRGVTLGSAGLWLPDKRQLVFMSGGTVQLPHHLTEGTSCQQWTPLADIERELRRIGFSGKVSVRGFYLDALNKYHLSEPTDIDLTRRS